MLEKCAKSPSWLKTHTRIVRANGEIYPALPKYDELAVGHVKHMLRGLKVDINCASLGGHFKTGHLWTGQNRPCAYRVDSEAYNIL